MRGLLIYAIIVLIIAIILMAFTILAAYYMGVLRNGTTLTSGQINAVFFTQIIGAVLVAVILIWSIFALAFGRRGYKDDDLDEDDGVIEDKEVVTVESEKQVRRAVEDYDLLPGDEIKVSQTGSKYAVKPGADVVKINNGPTKCSIPYSGGNPW